MAVGVDVVVDAAVVVVGMTMMMMVVVVLRIWERRVVCVWKMGVGLKRGCGGCKAIGRTEKKGSLRWWWTWQRVVVGP